MSNFYLLLFYINFLKIRNISRVFGNTVLLNKTIYPLHLREDSLMTVSYSINYLACKTNKAYFVL